MKKVILAFAISATFVSCGASATDWLPATRGELKSETAQRIEGDKNLQSQITQHGYEINTQAKYTSSVNEDLQASKAAGVAAYNQVQGQVTDLNGKIDQTRADGAAAIGETNEAVKAVDGKANTTNADLQASKAAGVAIASGLNGKIDGAVVVQSGVNKAQQANNVQQQNQINAVQGAAQTANDRATNLEGRADKVEGAVRETNAQVAVTDARSINNAVRLDGVESGVAGNTAAIKATNGVVAARGATISQHTAQIGNLDGRVTSNTTNIAKNTSDIKATNVTVNQHTSQLANHETRITGTEKVNTRQDVTLNQHTAALQQNASQWQSQVQVNNEYGQRLDAQDAMQSRFAGDIGNLKSQVAGMNDRINSADRKAEKALNAAAGALSVASIQFDTNVEAGFQVGAGVATLAGKNAAAIGVGGAINNRWFVSGYATQAGSASGAAVSATYSMGR